MTDSARNVDALDRWRQMCAAAQAANSVCGKRRSGDRWQQRAARFDRVGRQRQASDPALQALLAHIHATDVLLDVGAGAGRHAVPLARHAARVVAVEPSPAMRSRLEARIAEEETANVTVIPAAWPMPVPVACDVAYSIHVLYGIDDVVSFVNAMTRSARRECILVLGLRAPADATNELWRIVHGQERPPRPAAREALDVLQQLGCAASLHVLPASEHTVRIADSVEDIDEMCHRLRIEADDTGRARMRSALDCFRSPVPGGGYVLGATSPLALITWPGTHGR